MDKKTKLGQELIKAANEAIEYHAQPQPREWWILENQQHAFLKGLMGATPFKSAEGVHVIEYSAYEKLRVDAEIDRSEAQGVIEELELKLAAVQEMYKAASERTEWAVKERDAAIARAEGVEEEIKASHCIHGKHPLEECEECWESNKTLKRRNSELQSHADKLAAALEYVCRVQETIHGKPNVNSIWLKANEALAAYRKRGET